MRRRLLAKAIKYSMLVASNDYGISNRDYVVRVEHVSGAYSFSYMLNKRGRVKLLKHSKSGAAANAPAVVVEFLKPNRSIYQQLVHGPRYYHPLSRVKPVQADSNTDDGGTILIGAQSYYTMDFSLPSGDADNNSLDANLVFPR